MQRFKIVTLFNNKKQEIIFPDSFIEVGYAIRLTKKQFDYLRIKEIEEDAIFFDFVNKKIYYHDWYGTDNNYLGSGSDDYSHKVYLMERL